MIIIVICVDKWDYLCYYMIVVVVLAKIDDLR